MGLRLHPDCLHYAHLQDGRNVWFRDLTDCPAHARESSTRGVCMKIELELAAQRLREHDKILILTHKNPDGDTLGSGFGLYYGLKQLGKQVYLRNSDELPAKFSYFYDSQMTAEFEPDYIVSVDVGDTKLLGTKLEQYADKIDLCIDHHVSNTLYAKETYLDGAASSVSEILFFLLELLGIWFDEQIANCLYTGLVTDTGCFKFSNTGVKTHLAAARLIEFGADYERINRDMFETKSFARIALERMVLDGMEFYFDRRCAYVLVTRAMMEEAGADYTTFDGISAITRQIEGVDVGLTLREIGADDYKISVRTSAAVNASELCRKFDGGGHVRAAGCTLKGNITDVKRKLLAAAQEMLGSR